MNFDNATFGSIYVCIFKSSSLIILIIYSSKPTLKVKSTSGSSSTMRILFRNGSFVALSFTVAVYGFWYCKLLVVEEKLWKKKLSCAKQCKDNDL